MQGLSRTTRRLAAAVTGGLLVAAATAAAAEQPETGRLVEGLACRTDPSQTYTLYLPTDYSPERRWPALLILDPRGRSVRAAELFREAAEEYGWILLSSDNTRSDGPMEPNQLALNALWPEINARYATNHDRLYAAGFSGGAHMSWMLGKSTGRIAGVIASGGRLIPKYLEKTTYALYGAAGSTDFNYRGTHLVDALMADQGNPHRLEVFDGTHQWMPARLARQAVEWMEVLAMKQGLRPRDEALLDRLMREDLDGARLLESEGRVLEAQRRYAMVAATFAGLRAVDDARKRADELASSTEFARARKEAGRWDSFEERYRERMFAFCAGMKESETPVAVGQALRILRISRLQEQAASSDRLESETARRLLDTVFTRTSFYLANELLARGECGRAAVSLTVATRIRDDSVFAWYNLACAHARAGSSRAALEALERAVDLGFTNREHIESDPDLASLRDTDGFREIVDRLR